MNPLLQAWLAPTLEEGLRIAYDTLNARTLQSEITSFEVEQYRYTSSCISIHLKRARSLQIVDVSNHFASGGLFLGSNHCYFHSTIAGASTPSMSLSLMGKRRSEHCSTRTLPSELLVAKDHLSLKERWEVSLASQSTLL